VAYSIAVRLSVFYCGGARRGENMGNIFIISNNTLALAKYNCAIKVEGDVGAVFEAARDRIYQGAKLISHPLSGSVKPNQGPYKSIVLSATLTDAVDITSLTLIEQAIATLRKLPVLHRQYSEPVHQDFQVVDLDLLDSAMKALLM